MGSTQDFLAVVFVLAALIGLLKGITFAALSEKT
jgi:hypothetical protein